MNDQLQVLVSVLSPFPSLAITLRDGRLTADGPVAGASVELLLWRRVFSPVFSPGRDEWGGALMIDLSSWSTPRPDAFLGDEDEGGVNSALKRLVATTSLSGPGHPLLTHLRNTYNLVATHVSNGPRQVTTPSRPRRRS